MGVRRGMGEKMTVVMRDKERSSRDIKGLRCVIGVRWVKRGNTLVMWDKGSGSRDITGLRRVIGA